MVGVDGLGPLQGITKKGVAKKEIGKLSLSQKRRGRSSRREGKNSLHQDIKAKKNSNHNQKKG